MITLSNFRNTRFSFSLLVFLVILVYCVGVNAVQQKRKEASISTSYGQIEGVITNTKGQYLKGQVFITEIKRAFDTNENGRFISKKIPFGSYRLTFYATGYHSKTIKVLLQSEKAVINVEMDSLAFKVEDEIEISGNKEVIALRALNGVEGFGIYEGKKSEVVLVAEQTVNKATNNARQLFAQVPGLNIWESDEAGLQMDVAARGLSPSRSANFNTRLNGYDMSADAIGYPESYYAPAAQAVEKVVVVRGAASLQYGPQFGGMINFKLKEAPPNKKIELTTELTGGSNRFFNGFISVGGTNKKWSHYTYYQYKRGDGWRPNANYQLHGLFTKVGYSANEKLNMAFEYSFMDYKAHQPGGWTDEQFDIYKSNGTIFSNRSRNWFGVKWNLLALTATYTVSKSLKINTRNFLLLSGRDALGILTRIDRPDLRRLDANGEESFSNRTLIKDVYTNYGNETRLLKRYRFKNQMNAFVVGFRIYIGETIKQQGDGSNQSNADFNYLNPNDLEVSDFEFPSRNFSFFAEHIFNFSDKISFTPGLRLESILTQSQGIYKTYLRDRAGNIIQTNRFTDEADERPRYFPLFGSALSYKPNDYLELYSNFSQNFRAVTFADLRITNPNFRLDPNITDENGYNFDLGLRGKIGEFLSFDISTYYLNYKNRIGPIIIDGQAPTFLPIVFRTNNGNSRHIGLEWYTQLSLFELLNQHQEDKHLKIFSNLSLTDTKYVSSKEQAVVGNDVEFAPKYMVRGGVNFRWKNFKMNYQYSTIASQFTDATNVGRQSIDVDNTAVSGLIPSYQVMDLSFSYDYKIFQFNFSINNLTNERYYTRRATSYPGPGIIPATPRTMYLGLRLTI